GPLLKGILLVILEDEIVKDPQLLIRNLAVRQVTRIVLVPSLLRAILETASDSLNSVPHLKFWFSSGEPLSRELLQSFYRQLPGSWLINLYGSSEVAADVTCFTTSGVTEDETVPIGRPIANTEIYILDQHQQPLPLGITG